MSVRPDYDPKAADRYHAYRQGWRDAASGRGENGDFVRHGTRPDMVKAYLLGFNQSQRAASKALLAAQRKYKFTPSVLRATQHTQEEEPRK